MSHPPTDEQLRVLDAFATGKPLVIEAGAGTGKTTALVMCGDSTPRRGQYVAFNKAIVVDSAGRFGDTVAANTAHSLAFQAIGRGYKRRLDESRRIRNEDVARALRIDPIEMPTGAGNEKRKLSPAFLAGHVMRAIDRFCQTADLVPNGDHVPYIDGLDLPEPTPPEVPGGPPGTRKGWVNNGELRRYLSPFITRAWLDLCQSSGFLRFTHSTYLKLWQLSGPRIGADFILFDEAQDANPVMTAIIEAQEHAQRVYVGDGAQEIYAWTGAVNAMARLAAVDGTQIAYLSQSFRFGQPIADVANRLLEQLATPLRLRGLGSITSSVVTEEAVSRPSAVLCRTNATAVERVLIEQSAGRRPFLVGEGREVLSFASGAAELKERGHTSHPELSCFGTWGAVQAYVESDPQGHELRLLVRLVDTFGTTTIANALGRLPREPEASLVVTTAHKAKGREWDVVQLADDFPVPKPGTVEAAKGPDPAETRLLYVACTRARHVLDLSAAPLLVASLGLGK